MNHLLLTVAVVTCGVFGSSAFSAEHPAGRMLRDASLMLLKEGNARFLAGKTQHPNLDAERRSITASQGQEPFATVLACSDSRDPVELLFDRGIGDLFVIRVAGNIAGPSELASIEYAVGHLNTPVLVVLGHSKCGAVTAVTKNVELHGHLRSLAAKIQPAADKAKAMAADLDEHVPRAIEANVWNTIESTIKESDIVREKVAGGLVFIMGAIYDLETGKISWLGPHPAQEAVVALASQSKTDSSLAANGEGSLGSRVTIDSAGPKPRVSVPNWAAGAELGNQKETRKPVVH